MDARQKIEAAAALHARLEHIHAACLDTRPKQAVGEMIAAMLKMPQWAELARQQEVTAPVSDDVETMAASRYHIDKTEGGFWPYVVRCGNGTQVLHKGHLTSCQRLAQQLKTAFLDGAFVANKGVKADAALDATIKQRDRGHRFADEMAAQIAAITGSDIGEHSSSNCPWQQAVRAADDFLTSARVPVASPAEAAEREKFEQSALTRYIDKTKDADSWDKPRYAHAHVQSLWVGWMARAELAHPCHTELSAIHAVIMNIGGDWPEVAGDNYTLDKVKWLAREFCALTTQRVPVALPASKGQSEITLDFKQATELLEMFGGEPSTVTLAPGDGHSGKGLYAYWPEIPEEGAIYLGVTDDEAAPVAEVPCEDCNGRGVVGEPRYQGEFQPPEHDRCDSCGGSGKWKITPAPKQGDAKDARPDSFHSAGGECGGVQAHPMNYKGMWLASVSTLAKIDALLGLPEDGCNDPDVTLGALEDYMSGVKDIVGSSAFTIKDVRAWIAQGQARALAIDPDAAILASKATAAGEGK